MFTNLCRTALAAVFLSAAGAAVAAEEQPAPPTPAPAAQPAPVDPRDRELQALRRLVDELRRRVEELEKRPAPGATAVPAAPAPPAVPLPAPESAPPAPYGRQPPPGGATLLPNISAVANAQFRGGDTSRTEGRGQFRFQELEVAFQDAIAPNLRGDFFLASDRDEGYTVELDEGYLTATNLRPFGLKGLSMRLGRLYAPIGKSNPLHPHSYLYVEKPAVITALLNPDIFRTDQAVFEYLLPGLGKTFGRLELGVGENSSEPGDVLGKKGLGFRGGENGQMLWSGRLWLSREVGRGKELELGFSRIMGRGQIAAGVGPNQDLAVNGIDLTYRSYPAPYQRFLLQGEFLSHDTDAFAGSKSRVGGYLLASYRRNQYWEYGMRGDYTQFPYPINGHESSVSALLTRYITEQTSLRMQLTHGASPGVGAYNQILFQIIAGFGPHSHLLQ